MAKMTKIVSFSGVSNSGKTTLIEGLCRLLTPRFSVGVIKHDPKGKIAFDTAGKDSFKFFEAGASVAVISPNQTTLRLQNSLDNDRVMALFGECAAMDYIFIEGFKTMPYRRICVVREHFVDYDIEHADIIATTNAQNPAFTGKMTIDLNNHAAILAWIDKI